MSRLIVKNIPSNCDEGKLKQVFSKVGEVTDCKILQKGDKSRKFCFIGFKTEQEAEKARNHFNNGFVGTSKVQVEFAKTKDVLNREKKHKNNPEKLNAPVNQSRALGKFEEYKKIVDKGSKQSWNDLVIGSEMVIEERVKGPERKEGERKKPKIQEKKQEKEQAREKHIAKVLNKEKKEKEVSIKAPVFSQRNSKFIESPLKVDQTRLYVTNFSHDLSEEELLDIFSAYGSVVKTKFPRDERNKLKGYGFVTYSQAAESLRAFAELDNKIIYGRILHVKPALEDIGGLIKSKKEEQYQRRIREKFGDPEEDPTSYKKKQKIEMRQRLDDTTSWNTLFMNPDTLIKHMADKHSMTKSDILLSDNLPAKLSLAEAEVIAETKEWLVSQGLNLDFMSTDRNLCERSKVIILVKNLHYNTSPEGLKELFQFYGVVRRLMLCPNKAIAIVEFENEQFAKNALDKLSYYKFKNNPLYLEYAPINLMTASKVKQRIQQEQQQREYDEELSKILYIKNLNFETQEQSLEKHIKNCGNIRKVTIIRDRDGSSKGYAFIEFSNKQSVIKALKQYQNSLLDGHNLQLSISKGKKQAPIDKIKKKEGGTQGTSPKLSIKNIAFKATKLQIEELFKQYGNIKKLRLPVKMDNTNKGYGFVEYQTMEEANLAYDSLSSVHFYGRKLVVDWAKEETQ